MQVSTAWLLLVTSVVCDHQTQALHIPWWNIKLAQEQGPNVCVVEEVAGTKHNVWSECKYWDPRDICGTKPLLRYECCEGFQRVPDSQGCIGVKVLEDVLKTAQQLEAGIFVQYLENTGLSRELHNDGPYTLFAPSDEAFMLQSRGRLSRLNSSDVDTIRSVLQYHIVKGRMTSSHFKANTLIPTKNGKQLRVNKYSSRVETVNCALLQRKDQEASNGVVHIISDVLDPSFSLQRPLAELLVQDGRFRQLSQALDRAGLMSKLGSHEQTFTILAPSDEAFTKVRPSRLSKIINDDNALKELLNNHILPHLICQPAIIGEHKVQALGGHKVTFDCDKTGVKVEKNILQGDFTLGSNGVIHVVDDILVPDRAKSIIQILEEGNGTTFLQILQFAGLEDAFENFGEYTLFVPTESAMKALPDTTLRALKTDREKARKFVLFHVTQGRVNTEKLNSNQEITSLNDGKPLRIQLYRSGMTSNARSHIMMAVEGAIVQQPTHECMNGVVHFITKALDPANNTVEQLLQDRGTFNGWCHYYNVNLQVPTASKDCLQYVYIASRHFNHTTMEHPQWWRLKLQIFLNGLNNFKSKSGMSDKTKTFLVPTDAAFQKMDRNVFDQMMSDSTFFAKILKNHLSETMILFDGFQPGLHYSVPSLLDTLTITVEGPNMKVNNADVLEHHVMATNGIIHIINEVLLPN